MFKVKSKSLRKNVDGAYVKKETNFSKIFHMSKKSIIINATKKNQSMALKL